MARSPTGLQIPYRGVDSVRFRNFSVASPCDSSTALVQRIWQHRGLPQPQRRIDRGFASRWVTDVIDSDQTRVAWRRRDRDGTHTGPAIRPKGRQSDDCPSELRFLLERTTGFEPATPTLARWCSTN